MISLTDRRKMAATSELEINKGADLRQRQEGPDKQYDQEDTGPFGKGCCGRNFQCIFSGDHKRGDCKQNEKCDQVHLVDACGTLRLRRPYSLNGRRSEK